MKEWTDVNDALWNLNRASECTLRIEDYLDHAVSFLRRHELATRPEIKALIYTYQQHIDELYNAIDQAYEKTYDYKEGNR